MASKLLDQLRSAIRTRNYSIRTEHAYTSWVRRYIRYHHLRHPADLNEQHVVQFLTHLAVSKNVAANTQNQALSALVFFYKHVLHRPLGNISNTVRAKKPQKIPIVLDRQEVRSLLSELTGLNKLIAALLYGSGLRLMEALQLRVKDLDFTYRTVHVHNAKGAKDRVVTFPVILHPPMQVQLLQARMLHNSDLTSGYGEVYLPNALAEKLVITSIPAPSRKHSSKQ